MSIDIAKITAPTLEQQAVTAEEREAYKLFYNQATGWTLVDDPNYRPATIHFYRLAVAYGRALAEAEHANEPRLPKELTEEQAKAIHFERYGKKTESQEAIQSWFRDYRALYAVLTRPAKTPEQLQREREDAEDEAAWQEWQSTGFPHGVPSPEYKSLFLAGRRSQRANSAKQEVKS